MYDCWTNKHREIHWWDGMENPEAPEKQEQQPLTTELEVESKRLIGDECIFGSPEWFEKIEPKEF